LKAEIAIVASDIKEGALTKRFPSQLGHHTAQDIQQVISLEPLKIVHPSSTKRVVILHNDITF